MSVGSLCLVRAGNLDLTNFSRSGYLFISFRVNIWSVCLGPSRTGDTCSNRPVSAEKTTWCFWSSLIDSRPRWRIPKIITVGIASLRWQYCQEVKRTRHKKSRSDWRSKSRLGRNLAKFCHRSFRGDWFRRGWWLLRWRQDRLSNVKGSVNDFRWTKSVVNQLGTR